MAESYPLTRVNVPLENDTPEALALVRKARLKADREAGTLTLDGLTTLRGVLPEVWAYCSGNCSALDWALEPSPKNGRSVIEVDPVLGLPWFWFSRLF